MDNPNRPLQLQQWPSQALSASLDSSRQPKPGPLLQVFGIVGIQK